MPLAFPPPLQTIITRFKPDVVHASSPGILAAVAGVYCALRAQERVACVLSYHTHLPNYMRSYMPKHVPFMRPLAEEMAWALIRATHSLADLTLTTSTQLRDELLAHDVIMNAEHASSSSEETEGNEEETGGDSTRKRKRIAVWQRGVDTDVFNPRWRSQDAREMLISAGDQEQQDNDETQSEDARKNQLLMLYVGRLGAEKKVALLRDVLDELNAMPGGDGARLAIVGDGPDRSRLEKHFAPCGDRVVFTGLLQGEALSSAYASADVFVMPSESETLGFVVLESMASGVPVVAARAGGIPDIITNDDSSSDAVNGLMCTPGDANEFARNILALRHGSPLRDTVAANARQEVERWGWAAATQRLHDEQYEAAIANARTRRQAPIGLRLRRLGALVLITPPMLLLMIMRFIALVLESLQRKRPSSSSVDNEDVKGSTTASAAP